MTASNVAPDDSELLLPSSSDPATPPSVTSITRQKKAVSSPGVFLPRSLSQLEETVRAASSWAVHATPPASLSLLQVASPATAELLSNLEVDVSLMDDTVGSADQDDALQQDGSGPDITAEQSLLRVIFKSNDDLRQEMFAMLLIHIVRTAWLEDGLELYLREYAQ